MKGLYQGGRGRCCGPPIKTITWCFELYMNNLKKNQLLLMCVCVHVRGHWFILSCGGRQERSTFFFRLGKQGKQNFEKDSKRWRWFLDGEKYGSSRSLASLFCTCWACFFVRETKQTTTKKCLLSKDSSQITWLVRFFSVCGFTLQVLYKSHQL